MISPATNEQTRKTNKNSQAQTTVWWLPEEKRGMGTVKSKGGQIHVDRRRFDLGWWTHSAINKPCIIELYT